MSKFPIVGDKVQVRHQSMQRRDGTAYMTPAVAMDYTVTHVYLDGSVRVNSGDTWQVEPASEGWRTVVPREQL